jgi:hypothetical protein
MGVHPFLPRNDNNPVLMLLNLHDCHTYRPPNFPAPNHYRLSLWIAPLSSSILYSILLFILISAMVPTVRGNHF